MWKTGSRSLAGCLVSGDRSRPPLAFQSPFPQPLSPPLPQASPPIPHAPLPARIGRICYVKLFTITMDRRGGEGISGTYVVHRKPLYKRGLQKNNLHLNCCLRENHSFSQISENNLRDIHGELDILAVEVLEAEDVFVHSFASLWRTAEGRISSPRLEVDRANRTCRQNISTAPCAPRTRP